MKPNISLVPKIAFVLAVTGLAWFNVPMALIAICTTVLVSIYSKADSLIEISFGPLRAKLEREVSEAETLVQRLKDFAVLQAQAAVAASANTGRFASDKPWIYELTKRLEDSLQQLGVSPSELKRVRADLVRLTIHDAGLNCTGGSYVPMHLPREAQCEWKALRDSDSIDDPHEVRKWLLKWNVMTAEREQLLSDMQWIREHGDLRDVDQYMRARHPLEWK